MSPSPTCPTRRTRGTRHVTSPVNPSGRGCFRYNVRDKPSTGERWGDVQVPAQFEYEVATSVDEAVSLLRRYGPEARPVAGGHSLIPMMKLRLASPEVLIDIHKLDDELRYVRDDGGVLRIGALARHKDLLESPLIRERYALLADAERLIADPLVRNMGTVGGALANGDPAEDLPAAFVALGGEVVVGAPDG